MGQSYRIRTELGVNKTINLELDQDFEFLEILSLTIQQTDVYLRSCADYGVVVGRVTANNGFGIPNARVSVFVPIQQVDESNPVISSIYPYKSPTDKNEDGYRYNLLPYEASYTGHAATGTLPTRADALTGSTAVEVYDKYYKFTSKTNESGDYMIMGIPVGNVQFVMDVDLSDIGEFSLTPQDLIRIGRATEAQVAGNRFRSSTDLNSLPQIVNLTKTIEISPLWGDPDVCQIAINRLDFDLRDDANIDIQPTAVFMGSMISTSDAFRVRKNAKPRDNMGNLCQLTTGPGQILAIRQTIQQDSDGNPILEQYVLEQAGNVIDGNGVWLTELPMNLDYLITNEFGEKVLSNNPAIGIPTKAKYRFKIKWQQPPTLSEQVRRPYYIVPNVKEYGWVGDSDPNMSVASVTQLKKLSSSYYFGLAWSGYTDGFTGQEQIDRLNEIIDCQDSFYEFYFNRVYTVSGLIDEFKNSGGKGRFIGIKEIDNQDCENTVNKFPVNEGFRNFDFLFFLFSIILQVIQLIGLPLLIAYHFIAFLWNNFAVLIVAYLIIQWGLAAVNYWSLFGGAIAGTAAFGATAGMIAGFLALALLYTAGVGFLIANFKKIVKYKFGKLTMPMITYPACEACECDAETTSVDEQAEGGSPYSLLSQFSNPGLYYEKLSEKFLASSYSEDDSAVLGNIFSQSFGGRSDTKSDNNIYKTPKSKIYKLPSLERDVFSFSVSLPMGERINVFNSRKKYFDGLNRISVSFNYNNNVGKSHFDNTLTIMTIDKLETGTLLTFISPGTTNDVNFLYSATTATNTINGISGTPKFVGATTIAVNYANPSNQTQSLTTNYFLNTGTTNTVYNFPMDLEYYQVVTAITVSQAMQIWNSTDESKFPGVIKSCSSLFSNKRFPGDIWFPLITEPNICTSDYFADFNSQYITILQRGVDPYSPQFPNQYGIGKIFGLQNENDLIITANTKLNIPIQPITSGYAVQSHSNQNNIFYSSYFWEAGNDFSAFTSSKVGYYGALNNGFANVPANYSVSWNGLGGVVSKTSNNTYNVSPSGRFYDGSEDLSGLGYLYTQGVQYTRPTNVLQTYYSPNLYASFTANPLSISSKVKNVMRTDRLPSSDYLDGSGWNKNAALLQQNLGFATYVLNLEGGLVTSSQYNTGADIVTADISGQIYEAEVLTSLSECQKLVGLNCYSGFGQTFGIDVACKENDPVENGCYVMVRRPLLDLGRDFKTWSEWGFRFRFFYGLCRGVLSQTFTNNWVNGTLYTFPIQVDTFYDKQNKPYPPKFAKQLVYFDSKTNNFYYRSSPWQGTVTGGKFIGKPTGFGSVNKRNLLFPTTVINLGIKDSFYQEIIFDPSARAYIMKSLNPTSYSDTSDLVNLFVISRITDETFLRQIISVGDNSLNQLFSRDNYGLGNNNRRIDGDLAQAMSINSEFGVIPFSPEYYPITGQADQPVYVEGPPSDPTICIFFSSTTEDLQNKDFITPGVINFRPANNQNAITYPFGIKSQTVPFYQWGLAAQGKVFGNQNNNWLTNKNDIKSYKYQSLSRRFTTSPSYFSGAYNNISDIYQRGYIFAVDQNQNYAKTTQQAGSITPNFLVGAPFHFYFGLIKGESALDKFKTKYSIGE